VPRSLCKQPGARIAYSNAACLRAHAQQRGRSASNDDEPRLECPQLPFKRPANRWSSAPIAFGHGRKKPPRWPALQTRALDQCPDSAMLAMIACSDLFKRPGKRVFLAPRAGGLEQNVLATGWSSRYPAPGKLTTEGGRGFVAAFQHRVQLKRFPLDTTSPGGCCVQDHGRHRQEGGMPSSAMM